MDNDTIKDLGLCPICQKGHIMKGSLGYSCNYFKNMNDKCTFNIYHSYWGKEITEEIARLHIPKHTRSLSGSLLGYKTIP